MRADPHPPEHHSREQSQGPLGARDQPSTGAPGTENTPPSSTYSGEMMAALVVLAAGIYVAWEGSGYRLGSVARMGPGFVPLSLGVILIGLGIGLVFGAVRARTTTPKLPWRAFAAVMGAVVAFGLLAERAGLVPATIAVVTISSLAESPLRPWATALAAGVLSALGVLVFVHGFKMPLSAFEW